MKLYMVRHGQSETNLSGCFTGWAQVNLTEKGIQDAKRAGEALQGLHFDRIYSSDLIRAIQTAKNAIPGCEPIQDPLLREISLGELELSSIEECARRYGDQFQVDRANTNFVSYGGESKEMLNVRVEKFLDKLAQDPCEQAVAFAHAGTLLSALEVVLGGSISRSRARCFNASIAVFEYDGTLWRLYSWGLTH